MEPEHQDQACVLVNVDSVPVSEKICFRHSLVWLPATWRATKPSGMVIFCKRAYGKLLDGNTYEFMSALTH